MSHLKLYSLKKRLLKDIDTVSLVEELTKRTKVYKKTARNPKRKPVVDIIPNDYEVELIDWLINNCSEEGIDSWISRLPVNSVGTNNVRYREEWLERTLNKIPKGKSILDAGAGELQYKKFCSHLKYTSQDFAQYTGEGNDVGLQTGTWDNSKIDIVSDITNIPVDDNSFDAVMCVEVLEHVPKPIDALKEITRVLKTKGQLVLTAPFASFVHFAPYYYCNGFSRYFYETILHELGYKIIDINLAGNFFEVISQEIRRINDMATRYTPKKNNDKSINKLAEYILLNRLEELSKKDKGSSEFAVHDIQVLAVKQ